MRISQEEVFLSLLYLNTIGASVFTFLTYNVYFFLWIYYYFIKKKKLKEYFITISTEMVIVASNIMILGQ